MSRVRLRLDPWRHRTASSDPHGVHTRTEDEPTALEGVEAPLDAWRALHPSVSAGDAFAEVVMLDGVLRVDAHAQLAPTAGDPVPALLLSLAVGMTHHRPGTAPGLGVTAWRELRHPLAEALPDLEVPATRQSPGAVRYEAIATPDAQDAPALRHAALARLLEVETTSAGLARTEYPAALVIVDGPPRERAPRTLGVIKHTQRLDLPPGGLELLRSLPQGSRTPVYAVETASGLWWEWLVALRDPLAWAGPLAHTVRCRVPAGDLAWTRVTADWTAARLPAFALDVGRDPRAPQQLVPMAAIEREARRRLGSLGVIRRRLMRHLVHGDELPRTAPRSR